MSTISSTPYYQPTPTYMPWNQGQMPQMGMAQPQMAPQGFFSSALGLAAGPLGGLIGGALGNRKLGQTIGGIAGTALHFLPFSAGPGQPVQYLPVPSQPNQQMAPQGVLSDFVGGLAPMVGEWIGGDTGATAGGVIGDLISLLPFSAGPGQPVQYVQVPTPATAPQPTQQMAPQGIFGDLAGQFGGQVGQWAGGMFGQPNLGRQVGDFAGGLAQQYLPFSAAPQQQAYPQQYGQMAPQGIFGDIVGSIAGPVGGFIGGAFGNRRAGQQAGGIAGGLIKQFLPFSAGPGQPVQYAEVTPQGIFSDLMAANPNGYNWNKRPFNEGVLPTTMPFSVLPQQPNYPYATLH